MSLNLEYTRMCHNFSGCEQIPGRVIAVNTYTAVYISEIHVP